MSQAAKWLTEQVNTTIAAYAPLIKTKAMHPNNPDLIPILRELAKDITTLAVEAMQRQVREKVNAKQAKPK